MKILLDGRFYGLEHAGIGRYSQNLIDELAKIDTQNDYVVLLAPKYFKDLKLPSNWTKVKANFRHYTITEQLRLPMIIARHKPDLCHFLHFNVPVFYFGKFIVTLHDMEMHKSKGKEATTRAFFSYNLWRLGYKFVFANAVRRSVKIVVPTRQVKKEIGEYFKPRQDKIVVIYEGVNNSFSEKVSVTTTSNILKKYALLEKKYFFYNGNAYPHKNLPRAIDALKILNKTHKALLVIASSRSVFSERLIELVKVHNLQNLVKIIGFVTDEELLVLHQNSVAFLYPSLMEGFGLQGLEAMASGTLLCASDIPIFHEIYQGNALYFDPNEPESIVGTLVKAFEIPSTKRESMILSGKKYASRFSWIKMAKETLASYISVN